MTLAILSRLFAFLAFVVCLVSAKVKSSYNSDERPMALFEFAGYLAVESEYRAVFFFQFILFFFCTKYRLSTETMEAYCLQELLSYKDL